MSTNKELFKEAIADAKAVREAALANAKAALEEALTPKLQSMLAAKLQEMEYEEEGAMGGYTDENLEEEDFMQPDDTSDEMQQSGYGHKEQGRPSFGDVSEDEMEEDFDLSEILAELNEAEDEEEADEEEADEEEESDEESDEDMNVADMSVEELTDLIKSIVDQELEAEEAETPAEEEAEYTDGEEAGMEVGAEMGADSDEDEIDLEELLAELDALGETKEEEDEAMYEAKKKKDEKELEEAMRTIQTLRQEMNEVNLLNAKLLYVNKIFKAKNLTESQKLKVIASFDKATNVKEAKVVFESLNNALQTPAKKAIKESFGFASKATGVAQNRTIVESNDVITRMQKLANIIK